MSCPALVSASLIAVTLTMPLSACGGGDDKATTSPPPSNPPSGPRGTTPQDAPGRLPPAFVKCMADRGFDVTSSGDIHSAPPEALQTCFAALHQGGG